MKAEVIIRKLMEMYPLKQACSWDNPGLQVGRMSYSVHSILVALDATWEVIQECIDKDVDMLVTHHPLIMGGVKKLNENDFLGNKALTLAEHKIAHFAMHTNYDVTTMNQLAKEKLGLCDTQILEEMGEDELGNPIGIGTVGTLSCQNKVTARQVCDLVKRQFDLENVRLFGDPDTTVTRVAISAGSGKSMVAPALACGSQILITGDIGHHDGLDAVDQGMLIIDAGHFGIEKIFIPQMTEFLKGEYPELEIHAAGQSAPFIVI